MANTKESSFAKLNCFLIGLGAGAVVALLFAPKSGKALRKDISDNAQRGVEFANSGMDQVRNGAANIYTAGVDKASNLYGAGKELIDNQKEILASAFDAGKKAYQVKKDSNLKIDAATQE
jgi:gas vesicle protein